MSRYDKGVSVPYITPYLDRADIVVIGNGIAGLTAAIEARRLAPEKRIVILTEQIHPTINTPALKQFAVGKLSREQLLAYPAGTEKAERIHIVTARVEEIHAHSKYVTLNGGRGFGYESLLIATGSTPTGLSENVPGCDFDGVVTLHRLQDYLNLRRRIAEVSEAVVIGGGAHAIETVMSLLHWGIHVKWLIRSRTFMPHLLDEPASQMVLSRVKRAGADIHTETEVVGIVGRVGSVVGVITDHQEMLPCQLVVCCTGTQPLTTLAQHCTQLMRYKRGILVDDHLHTTVRDIYAAGDVAALKNPLTGTYETRAQWYAAVSQGRIVGAIMTGHEELARQPFGVRWHATQLGELSMLTVGDPLTLSDKVTTLTDTGLGGYRRLAIVDDRLVGYLSLGPTQPDSLAIKRIIDERHSIRTITKALLRGNFDARKYLSQQHTSAAQGLLTSGRLPALASALASIGKSTTRRLPVHISGRSASPTTPRLLPLAEASALAFTEAQTDPMPQIEEHPEELLRQTGPLQHAQQAVHQTDPLLQASAQQSEPYTVEEEIGPFTGNLPTPPRIIESTLLPASAYEGRSPTGSLWSYTSDPNAQDEQRDERRPTGSLWSYSTL